MTTTIVTRASLVVSIVAGSFVVATPAKAGITFHNYANENYCMGVYGGGTSVGSQLVLWTCDGSANQDWFDDIAIGGNSFFEVQDSAAPSMCIDLPPGTNPRLDTPQLILSGCDGANDQGWYFVPQFSDGTLRGRECYIVENYEAFEDDGYWAVIGVYAGSMTDGASIVLWPWSMDPVHHPDQYWCLSADGPV
jgi:hypothetical protein